MDLLGTLGQKLEPPGGEGAGVDELAGELLEESNVSEGNVETGRRADHEAQTRHVAGRMSPPLGQRC